jgi:hypothetical protein
MAITGKSAAPAKLVPTVKFAQNTRHFEQFILLYKNTYVAEICWKTLHCCGIYSLTGFSSETYSKEEWKEILLHLNRQSYENSYDANKLYFLLSHHQTNMHGLISQEGVQIVDTFKNTGRGGSGEMTLYRLDFA